MVAGEEGARGRQAEQHRGDHSQGRDPQRGGPDRCHPGQIGLEADLEQQEQHPHLGQHLHRREVAHPVEGVEAGEAQVADQDAGAELAQHRGLAVGLGRRAPQPRHHHHDQEPEQHREHVRGGHEAPLIAQAPGQRLAGAPRSAPDQRSGPSRGGAGGPYTSGQ